MRVAGSGADLRLRLFLVRGCEGGILTGGLSGELPAEAPELSGELRVKGVKDGGV